MKMSPATSNLWLECAQKKLRPKHGAQLVSIFQLAAMAWASFLTLLHLLFVFQCIHSVLTEDMKNSTASPPSLQLPEALRPQVTWQTVFWVLVALAINAMAQPGGRICGIPSRYRTYLRCSPILCFADSVSIIVQFLANRFLLRLPGLESLAVIIHERLNPDVISNSNNPAHAPGLIPDEDTEEFKKTERLTFLRWLWFILGTLPPTIKLFAMEGVPWTKIWGAMFLSSWIINEGLAIFGTVTQSVFTISSNGQISWPGYERTTHLARWAQGKRWLEYVEKFLAATALISHLVVINSTYRSVWRLLVTSDDHPLSSTIVEEFRWKSYPYRVMNPSYTFSVTTVLLLTMGLASFSPRAVRNFLSISYVAWFLFSCQLMLVTTSINSIAFYGTFYSTPSGGYVSSTIVVFFFSTIAVASFIPLVWWCCMQSVKLGVLLLISFSEYHGSTRRLKVDYIACLALAFFMNTILASVLGYCYIFDPTNTYNPVWTGVFG